MHIDISRGRYTDAGVFGIFYIDGLPFSSCLEKLVPAIAPGDYLLTRYNSPKHGMVWRFTKPNDPTFADHEFEIHPANVYLQLLGCVAIGQGFQDFDLAEIHDREGNALGEGMERGIANSDVTFARFMALTAAEQQIPITVS